MTDPCVECGSTDGFVNRIPADGGFLCGGCVAKLEAERCEACDDLPEDHPDWMKGFCEDCYDEWARAWRTSE